MALRISAAPGSGLLLLILFMATVVAAEDDDAEFAFNIFSDVAPILALFGEQFARQFMSESLTWLDHLIFAMVPLGIVASVTGAIRVQGPHIAKAFIGRARENRALVEFELMSSTSHEVGEAFNGRGIVRVMGKPKIAEFLIFPKEYEAAEMFYDPLDGREARPDPEEDRKHALCGIHSFESAIQEDQGMMQCRYYHSHSYKVLDSWLTALLKRVQPDVEQGQSTEQSKRLSRESLKDLGPPNLQLNFSSDHVGTYRYAKRIELIVTAIIAVTMQTGLLALAAATVLYQPLRNSIGSDPKGYGLPCYFAGSIMLSVGVGVCSYAVERNTTEFVWTILNKQEKSKDREDLDRYPRLIFLQKRQVVNDQAFDAFAMLAGPKRQIIASARNATSGDNANKQDGHQTGHDLPWELITVGAAAMAGVGFTAQFMGLRGLTYPSSIAQILAIIVMTLLRAGIRRRMGREPANCETFAEYELDYLAMRIVFNPKFRDYRGPLEGRKAWGESPGDAFFWEVKLPESTKVGPRQRHPAKETVRDLLSVTQGRKRKPNEWRDDQKPEITASLTATSGQLIRVRRRLGDLCRWSSKASEAALILCRSIEAFMHTFFPAEQSRGTTFSWAVEARHVGSDGSAEPATKRATVIIPIVCEEGEWNIDLGSIEAVLSLWMASIEAEFERKNEKGNKTEAAAPPQTGTSSRKQSNWRRRGGIASDRHIFYRILGEDDKDGALKRDLSWWVGGHFTIQGRSAAHDEENSDTEDMEAKSQESKEHGSLMNPEFTIGFNRDASYSQGSGEKKVEEIGLEGEASLPIILTQHLFTDFVWTMSKSLPENCLPFGFENAIKEVAIEERHRFDPDYFDETWYLPKLSHVKLSELVRQIEMCGMGTSTDILLCIIPAFSTLDRLPNQAMLQLIPSIGKDNAWIPIARCYNSLLSMSMRTEKPESLCIVAVIYAMDFLYFAHLPYDTVIEPPTDLKEQLEKLASLISLPRFKDTVSMLVPIHNLQGRRAAFDTIYKQYKTNTEVADGCLKLYETMNIEIGQAQTRSILAFSESHKKVYVWLKGPRGSRLHLTRKEGEARDIFGWTPIHYSCIFNEGGMELEQYTLWWDDILKDPQAIKLHKQLDRFGRSPVHIAASNGRGDILQSMFSEFILDRNEASSAVNAAGADGMTPMHWAAQSSEPDALEVLMKSAIPASTHSTDIWGREPLHIAARQGHEKVVDSILKTGAWSLSTDSLSKSPVNYVLTQPSSQDPAKDPTSNDSDGGNSDKDKRLIKDPQRLRILARFAMERPSWKDHNGRSFLHHAVEVTELETVQELVESQKCNPAIEDSDGQTVLHAALDNNNVPVSLYLLGLPDEKLREIAKAEASLLIDACKGGCTPAIPRILELWPEAEAINKGDARYDQPALSWAIETGHNDAVEIIVNNHLTDLNRTTRQFYDFTPVHFAAKGDNADAMALLLKQPSERIDLHKKDTLWNETPLESVIRRDQPQNTKLLLLHPQTPDVDRKRHLKSFLNSSSTTFQDIIADIFEHMVLHDSLSDEELLELIETSATLDDPKHFEAFMMIILRENILEMVNSPYQLAIQANSSKIITELLKRGVDSTKVNEDNWSLDYCASRFGRAKLLEELSDGMLQRQELTTYSTPEDLFWEGRHDCVSVGACIEPLHKDCAGINNISVTKADKSTKVCIRSKECISPSSSHNYFYFEIRVMRDSPSRDLGLGYCRDTILDGRMPGWDRGSWAWHGDTGRLYVESGGGSSFADPESYHPFKAGDVAGVGMDFQTGQGFCTLNGIRLRMGNSGSRLQNKEFHIGKLYPCVGFEIGEGLQVEINFGGSPDHPFVYKGPFKGEIEE